MFSKKDLYILNLNVNSLPPKIYSIIGVSQFKLDSSILNSKVDFMGYDEMRIGYSSREDIVTYHIKKSLSYKHQSRVCPNNESIFLDTFLPKSKQSLVKKYRRKRN